MCSVYESATFLEVFKDFSFKLSTALYEDLDDSTIRSKIIKLRLTHNLTQLEFAKKIHRGFGTVTKWEQGLTNPSDGALEDIILTFNLDSNFFNRHPVSLIKI